MRAQARDWNKPANAPLIRAGLRVCASIKAQAVFTMALSTPSDPTIRTKRSKRAPLGSPTHVSTRSGSPSLVSR
jgi:hypothetical protein